MFASGATRVSVLAAAALLAAPFLSPAGASEDEPPVGPDGLHKQEWFSDTFLDMGEDLADSAAEGKGLIVLVEQAGCPYCAELHKVNFRRDEITDLIKAKFNVVQLDLWGSREATDFDGEAMEERDLAAKWGVNFTPTTLIFAPEAAGATSEKAAESLRLPGYLKPFHYVTALEFVSSGAYRETDFQRYLREKVADLVAKGVKPDIW